MDSKWTRLLLGAAAIGVLYLAAGTGGAAQAGPKATAGKLSKKSVKKLVNKQLKAKANGLSVGHADSASSADQADNAENLAGLPARSYQRTVQWAVVQAASGASVVRGNATGASRLAQGRFIVSFERDIRGCAYLATNGSTGAGAGAAGYVAVGQGADRTEVEVDHYNTSGSLADYNGVDGFHIAVIC